MTDRARESTRFIERAGWGDAERSFLTGDASNRSYDRLILRTGGRQNSSVLMDAPPEKGEDVRPFILIDRHLRELGLSAPEILAEDSAKGFLLLEDLGNGLFARVVEKTPQVECDLYAEATDVLVRLQRHPAPCGLPRYDTAAMAQAAALAVTWYRFAITDIRDDPASLIDAISEALDKITPDDPVMILRDYHAENLIWLPDRVGIARVGLLDFQNAETGLPVYDLISLLQDARRDVSDSVVRLMMTRFADATGSALDDLSTAAAVAGAQRALRILGAFARLSLHYGKPGYVRLIPRVWGQLQVNLQARGLGTLRKVVERLLPPPDAGSLDRITERCGTIPTL